jgi:hypothetical protein
MCWNDTSGISSRSQLANNDMKRNEDCRFDISSMQQVVVFLFALRSNERRTNESTALVHYLGIQDNFGKAFRLLWNPELMLTFELLIFPE